MKVLTNKYYQTLVLIFPSLLSIFMFNTLVGLTLVWSGISTVILILSIDAYFAFRYFDPKYFTSNFWSSALMFTVSTLLAMLAITI